MKVLISVAAADNFEFEIPAKFGKLLKMSDKQKDELITDVENESSFVNEQEVVTVEHIEVKGNKIKVWPMMDLLDEPISGLKPKMVKAFVRWASGQLSSLSSDLYKVELEAAVGVTEKEIRAEIARLNKQTKSKATVVGIKSAKPPVPSWYFTLQGSKRDVTFVAAAYLDEDPDMVQMQNDLGLQFVKV